MPKIRCLSLQEIMQIHETEIMQFGGLNGIRDDGLLLASLYFPQASFAGEYLHSDIFEMAAAYAFSIIKNHAFLDGNKRTGIVASIAFLGLNDIELNISQDELFDLAIAIATSKASIKDIAHLYKKNCL